MTFTYWHWLGDSHKGYGLWSRWSLGLADLVIMKPLGFVPKFSGVCDRQWPWSRWIPAIPLHKTPTDEMGGTGSWEKLAKVPLVRWGGKDIIYCDDGDGRKLGSGSNELMRGYSRVPSFLCPQTQNQVSLAIDHHRARYVALKRIRMMNVARGKQASYSHMTSNDGHGMVKMMMKWWYHVCTCEQMVCHWPLWESWGRCSNWRALMYVETKIPWLLHN